MAVPVMMKLLRDARIKKGHLLVDMARIIGCGVAELSAVECGKIALPSVWAPKLSDAYPELTLDVLADTAAEAVIEYAERQKAIRQKASELFGFAGMVSAMSGYTDKE